MAFSCANLAALKSGALAGSNLLSATKKQKYGYTPLQTDPTAAPRETFYFTIESENSITHETDVTDHSFPKESQGEKASGEFFSCSLHI